MMNCEQDYRDYANQWLDAGPVDMESTDEYSWELTELTHQDMVDTGIPILNTQTFRDNIKPELSDLSRPVVVSLGDTNEHVRIFVWDGVHRIISARQLGRESIPAVLGRRKTRYDWSQARVRDLPTNGKMQMMLALPLPVALHMELPSFDQVKLFAEPCDIAPLADVLNLELKAFPEHLRMEGISELVPAMRNEESVVPIFVREGKCLGGRPVLKAAEILGLRQVQVVHIEKVLADKDNAALLRA